MRETMEFPPMMGRLIRAHMLRVIEGDLYDLREFYDLRAELDAAIQTAIVCGRSGQPEAWSWSNIGDALGMTRQAAQQRWGRPHVPVRSLTSTPGVRPAA